VRVPVSRKIRGPSATLGMKQKYRYTKRARCRIATTLLGPADSPEKLIERITPWLEREFEQTREAALKSIRTERKLLEISFDTTNPGPFA
jgi:hypothetical protein